MKPARFGLAALLAVAFSSACFADDIVATQEVAGSRLRIQLKPTFTNMTLTVAGPHDFHASSFSKGSQIEFDLSQLRNNDGIYHYQVTAKSGERAAIMAPLDNGREKPDEQFVAASMSGTFHVKGGEIVKPASPRTGRKDQ